MRKRHAETQLRETGGLDGQNPVIHTHYGLYGTASDTAAMQLLWISPMLTPNAARQHQSICAEKLEAGWWGNIEWAAQYRIPEPCPVHSSLYTMPPFIPGSVAPEAKQMCTHASSALERDPQSVGRLRIQSVTFSSGGFHKVLPQEGGEGAQKLIKFVCKHY